MLDLKKYISEIPDFPKAGILFYDISPILANPKVWSQVVINISNLVRNMNADIIVALESRGFFIAGAVAKELNVGFVLARKKGKLPGEVFSYAYGLEYGTSTLEIKKNILQKNQKVVIIDDLLATGGSLNAVKHLVELAGANVVGATCIIELLELKGRENIDFPIETLIQY